MCVQFFFSLKVKYPKHFSARVVSRYAWMDVRNLPQILEELYNINQKMEKLLDG